MLSLSHPKQTRSSRGGSENLTNSMSEKKRHLVQLEHTWCANHCIQLFTSWIIRSNTLVDPPYQSYKEETIWLFTSINHQKKRLVIYLINQLKKQFGYLKTQHFDYSRYRSPEEAMHLIVALAFSANHGLGCTHMLISPFQTLFQLLFGAILRQSVCENLQKATTYSWKQWNFPLKSRGTCSCIWVHTKQTIFWHEKKACEAYM